VRYIILEKAEKRSTEGQLRRIVSQFVLYCRKYLKLNSIPEIKFVSTEVAKEEKTFGKHRHPDRITIDVENRHPVDILRTLAHELTHHKQDEDKTKKSEDEKEKEANYMAGTIVKSFVKKRPKLFTLGAVKKAVDYVVLESGYDYLHNGHWVQGRWFPDILREPKPGVTQLGEEVTKVEEPYKPEGGGVRVYSIDEIYELIERLERIGEEWDRRREENR